MESINYKRCAFTLGFKPLYFAGQTICKGSGAKFAINDLAVDKRNLDGDEFSKHFINI